MSGIFGALGVNDGDRVYLSTLGQRVAYDAIQAVLTQYSADLNAALGVFVDQTTSDYKLRYKLPGGGRLQRRGGQAQSAAVKGIGSWDVALPLEEFGDQLAWNREDYAYMTADDLNRQINTVMIQDMNTVRHEILRALFNNTARTFIDKRYGSLTIQPLANGDAVVYPPAIGSESEATDNHYLESGYAASAISDTNNPFPTVREELEEHFGTPTGGGEVVVFFNQADLAKISNLTAFDPVNDRFVRPGANTDVPESLPPGLPGRVVGRVNEVWAVEWRWMPANYLLAVNLAPDVPKPLLMRVDPAYTNLGLGLQLVAEDGEYPFTTSHYEHRFGLGVGNRLNGVVMELGTGGTYTIPSGYS